MIMAGTGHRPEKLGGYDNKNLQRLLYGILDGAMEHYKPTKVICGMALGFDSRLAEAAIRHRIPLVAAIPFEGQEKRWPILDREHYRGLLEKADEVIYVCEPGFANFKMQERNKWMVDRCDCLLALWDGGMTGGTANCIAYAQLQHKPIANLWDIWKACAVEFPIVPKGRF